MIAANGVVTTVNSGFDTYLTPTVAGNDCNNVLKSITYDVTYELGKISAIAISMDLLQKVTQNGYI